GQSMYTVSGGTATQVGTYKWTATYTGDGPNDGAVEPKTDAERAAAQVTTVKASPGITTSASETNGGVVGSAVLSDTATLSGGYTISGGSITFTLTAPEISVLSLHDALLILGQSMYTVSGGTATQVGTYKWTATY